MLFSLGSDATSVKGEISVPRGLARAKRSLLQSYFSHRERHGIKKLHQAFWNHDYAGCRCWASGAINILPKQKFTLAELPAYRAGGGLRSMGRPSSSAL